MKKIISFTLAVAILCLALSSCEERRDAYSMLHGFISAYGAEGVIYSPVIPEGEQGYITDGLIEKLYIYSGELPDNFAIFLANRTESFSECAIFICRDADMLAMVEEMCLERVRLLSAGRTNAFVRKSRMLVFYSTMQDRSRAERLFSEIIR